MCTFVCDWVFFLEMGIRTLMSETRFAQSKVYRNTVTIPTALSITELHKILEWRDATSHQISSRRAQPAVVAVVDILTVNLCFSSFYSVSSLSGKPHLLVIQMILFVLFV